MDNVEEMNIAEAKATLPNVRVKMPDGETYVGKVSGRKNQFPSVNVKYHGLAFSFETSWAQVAEKAADKTQIIYC